MAFPILEGSNIDNGLWMSRFWSMEDCFALAMKTLENDQLGNFTAILWEIWNARNCFLFGRPDKTVSTLSKRAISFVHNYCMAQEREGPVPLCPIHGLPLRLAFSSSTSAVRIWVRWGGDVVLSSGIILVM